MLFRSGERRGGGGGHRAKDKIYIFVNHYFATFQYHYVKAGIIHHDKKKEKTISAKHSKKKTK